MLNELLRNQDSTLRLYEAINRTEKAVFPSGSKLDLREKLKLVESFRQEAKLCVINPLVFGKKQAVLQDWLRDQLLGSFGFFFDENAPYRLRLGVDACQLDKDQPEERLRQSLALEIYEPLMKRGFFIVEKCRFCKLLFFRPSRNDMVFCSNSCRISNHKKEKLKLKRRKR